MIRPGLLIVLAACLGGCGYTPEQLGITGPGTAHTALPSHASEAETDAIIAQPGLPTGSGGRYVPSMTPSYGQNGRFYGYN